MVTIILVEGVEFEGTSSGQKAQFGVKLPVISIASIGIAKVVLTPNKNLPTRGPRTPLMTGPG
jgi:hypothetical protein